MNFITFFGNSFSRTVSFPTQGRKSRTSSASEPSHITQVHTNRKDPALFVSNKQRIVCQSTIRVAASSPTQGSQLFASRLSSPHYEYRLIHQGRSCWCVSPGFVAVVVLPSWQRIHGFVACNRFLMGRARCRSAFALIVCTQVVL
jgi:hypothetical protein